MKPKQYPTSLFLAFVFFYFALLPAEGRGTMVVQACFSPLGKCSSHILREIEQAKIEILVALFAFTNEELAWALIQAHRRGVKVRVVLDQEFDAENRNSKGTLLTQEGLSLKRLSGLDRGKGREGSGHMHQKFAVIDRKTVLTGSYNWTLAAERLNDENLLLFRDAGPLAEEYRKEFFRLWEKQR